MTINKIAVVGTGYVGLSLATLLSQHNNVVAVDVIQGKVDLINNKKSPIQDSEIEDFLVNKKLKLVATTDGTAAYKDADIVIIATPTNYDSRLNFFDTHFVEQVIELVLEVNPDAIMIIKSTIPVRGIQSLFEKNITVRILFFHQNSYVKAKLCTITCIQAELLLEQILMMNGLWMLQKLLQSLCRKMQPKKIFPLYIWDLQKRRR